jgi:hypothetical protein
MRLDDKEVALAARPQHLLLPVVPAGGRNEMKRYAYLALMLSALLAAGCARVGVPPGRDRVEDDEPPRLKKLETVDANHLEIYFSEGMDETTLREAENYAIVNEAGEPLAVEAAVVTQGDAVTLITDDQRAGDKYTLSTRNVADASGGNAIERDNTKTFKGSKHEDEKPPAAAATFPGDGAEQVGLFPEITVEYTDVMTPVADVADVIAMYDDLGTEVRGEGSFDKQLLRFRPGRRLDYATRYTVVAKDTATDLAGNLLYRESRFTFLTIEDSEEAIITGRVNVLEEGVSPAGVEVRLSLSPDPAAESASLAGYARADEEGKFVMRGVPPNSESKAAYHLVATLDENGDGIAEFVGGYGFSGGKTTDLPPLLGGDRLENLEVVLTRADVGGPGVTAALLSPDPTAGQPACYVRASFVDAGGSPVAGAEVFFDDIWSDGTGVALYAVGADWNTSSAATAERYVLDLREVGVKKKGPHTAYFHAKDAAGNWGEFLELPFELSGPPDSARSLEGAVTFEMSPAKGALVEAFADGDDVPCAIAVSEKSGEYKIEDLAPGRYTVKATLDEDEDGRWRKGEPEGVAERPADLTGASARGVDVRLAYGPSLSSANARLHNVAAGPGTEAHAVLVVSAAARDRDMNLARVWAVLPNAEEVMLLDDGTPPDDAESDGVFTFSREYGVGELASLAGGDVAVWAEDGQGNRVSVTAAQSPSLTVRRLEPPPALLLDTAADALTVSWEAVAGADGGYVVFLVPADRLDRFTGPGTGEVYSNFHNPSYGTTLTISYNAVEDWWAYPAKSRFVVFLVASAGDGDSYQTSDKAIISAPWFKPAARR